MSMAVQHVSCPDYWMVYLASSIGSYLNGTATDDDLARDYKEFLADPHVLLPEAREMLPAPPKKGAAR